MSYSDGSFQSRYLLNVDNDYSLTTFTASGANALTQPGLALPKFVRRTKVNKIQLVCRTIPNAGATGLKAVFLNGTSTMGEVTLTTATAGQRLDGTVTAANAVYSLGSNPTLNVIGTATASGGAVGVFDIFFECQEQPDSAN